jgi:rod shape-determining protein MreD
MLTKTHTASSSRTPALSLRVWIAIYGLALLVVLAQLTLGKLFSIWGLAPSLVLALMVYLTLQLGAQSILPLALVSGLFADLFTFNLLGSSAFALCLTVWLVGLSRDIIYRKNLWLYLTIITAATLVNALVIRFIYWIYLGESVFTVSMLWKLPLESLLNFLVLLLLLPLVKQILKGKLNHGK